MRAVTENDATTDYFSGDKDFPVFSRVQTGYGCEQLIKLLMTPDIFGQQVGAVHKEGLVDCGSEEEFDAALQKLEPIWNTREQPYATSSVPQFYGFFCQYQANVVKYHMRRDVREAAGLGAPPSTFTTNSSESSMQF